MKKGSIIVKQMTEHCLGDSCPMQCLLETGCFPDGWLDQYLIFLEEATRCWRNEPNWPRELVTAIHTSSWYFEIRYKAWCTSTNSRNTTTEDQLAMIRTPSELFLLAGEHVEKNDYEYKRKQM